MINEQSRLLNEIRDIVEYNDANGHIFDQKTLNERFSKYPDEVLNHLTNYLNNENMIRVSLSTILKHNDPIPHLHEWYNGYRIHMNGYWSSEIWLKTYSSKLIDEVRSFAQMDFVSFPDTLFPR